MDQRCWWLSPLLLMSVPPAQQLHFSSIPALLLVLELPLSTAPHYNFGCDSAHSETNYCERGCCRPIEKISRNDPICEFLLEDGNFSWLYPDRLFKSDVSQDFLGNPNRKRWCCRKNDKDKRYRISITDSTPFEADTAEAVTNRLRFDDSVIAQEGSSFCIVGRHYRRTIWQHWEPLRGFARLAEKSFDIGNHIDPEDSGKMNSFVLPNPDLMKNTYKVGVWGQPEKWPQHKWQYVWLGQRPEGGWCRTHKNHWYQLIEGYKKRPAHPEHQPDISCRNPYRVTVTSIRADEHVLHNYLHIKVYSEPASQPANRNCPTGKFKLLMLEVRDQDGLPVGQFTDDIPCEQDKKTVESPCNSGVDGCVKLTGSKRNQVPCMFTHPKLAVHPTIFMAAAEGDGGGPGGGGRGGGLGGGGGESDACRDSTKPQSERKPPTINHEAPGSYFTEVHATWRYAQHNAGWVSELHFATMIIEDDTPIQYYTSRKSEWWGLERCELWHTVRTDYCGYDTDYYPIIVGGGEYVTKYYYCDKQGQECCWQFRNYDNSISRCGRSQICLLNTCINSTYNSNRPYGYSARYAALKPTWRTAGGWDFFQKRFIRPSDVDCHVDIPYGADYKYTLKDSPGAYSKLPDRRSLSRYMIDHYTLDDRRKYRYGRVWELPDWHTPGKSRHIEYDNPNHPNYKKKMEWHYHGKLPEVPILKMFRSAHQDPIVVKTEFPDFPAKEYFGSNYLDVEHDPATSPDVSRLQKKLPRGTPGVKEMDVHDNEWSFTKQVKEGKTRCPCPFVPTTPRPELQTKRSVEIEGRRSHVVQMLIGWVILVPLSFFVARFYKGTFSKVFFLQEFWWYTIHVICLLTTLFFTVGGLYALKIKRTLCKEYAIVWTEATKVHIYFGYGLIAIFVLHLMFGSFRAYNVEVRMIQMSLHWGFGWLEYAVANVVILSAMGIPSGILNCTSLYIYIAFLVAQLAFTIGMELHMRKTDKEMDLNPPRSYLPSPVMRMFHKDAPHSYFRIVILGIFFLVCVGFYTALHLTMDFGSEFSCFQPS